MGSPFEKILENSPSITGRTEYLSSPFVTAGDRLYMVGNQDGSFPEIGWHLPGEMGGMWDHPIKLMDGFQIALVWPELSWSLDNADDTSLEYLQFCGPYHQSVFWH